MSAPDDVWRTPRPAPQPYGGFFPDVPGGFPQTPPTPPVGPTEPPVDVRAESLTGLVVLALCTFLGAPLGLIWAAFRPALDPLTVSAAAESALKPQFTADLTLALLGLIGGAIAGTLAWAVVRRHGTGTAAGLALGGYAAMHVAAQVGKLAAHPDQLRAVTERALGPGEMLAGSQQQIRDFLDLLSFHLRSDSVLYTFSIAALLLFGLLTHFRDRNEQRVSWGSAAAGSVRAPAQPSGS